MSAESQVPVGTVCAMFGLNPNTLRTWERRYQFPSPVRNAGGHRAYSAADIERISQIVGLIRSGISPAVAIAQVINAPVLNEIEVKSAKPTDRIENILQLVEALDVVSVNAQVDDAFKQMGYAPFIEELAFPVLARLGHVWETDGFGVAAEHLFSLTVKGVILERLQGIAKAKDASVVAFACVPEEQHQLPLLHLAVLVAEQGVARPLVLSAGLPIEETLAASKLAKARLIVLSATVAPDSTDTRAWLKQCIEAGWADRVFLAGPGYFRSRVYAKFPVRAAASNFQQTVDLLRDALSE